MLPFSQGPSTKWYDSSNAWYTACKRLDRTSFFSVFIIASGENPTFGASLIAMPIATTRRTVHSNTELFRTFPAHCPVTLRNKKRNARCQIFRYSSVQRNVFAEGNDKGLTNHLQYTPRGAQTVAQNIDYSKVSLRCQVDASAPYMW